MFSSTHALGGDYYSTQVERSRPICSGLLLIPEYKLLEMELSWCTVMKAAETSSLRCHFDIPQFIFALLFQRVSGVAVNNGGLGCARCCEVAGFSELSRGKLRKRLNLVHFALGSAF